MSKFSCFNLAIDNHIAMLKMNRPDSFNSRTRESRGWYYYRSDSCRY